MIKKKLDLLVKNKIYLLLFLIVLFAGFLRFYKITEVPVSLYWDEISSTYNAYSILNTGKDEFGNFLPLLFRAFEDYKTPANIYLTIIPVKIFGLNEFSARFTSAFLGILTVLICFFFIKELLNKKYFELDQSYIALLTSFLLAISPWHLQFSRTGFEANVGLFFVVLGGLLFMKFINKKRYKYLYVSMLIFALSIYFYRSLWIFVPLLIFSFMIIYRQVLFNKINIKNTLFSFLIFILIMLPFIPVMVSKNGLVRANQTSVITNSSEKVYESAKKREKVGGLVGALVYNRRTVYLTESAIGYFKHFSPKFLFIEGDGNKRHGVPNVGLLYLWGIIFIIPGIYALFKIDKKSRMVIIAWLVLAPIPAAISLPSPHALRSLNMIPMIQLLISLGLIWIFANLKGKMRKIYIIATIFIIVFFFNSYLRSYYGKSAIEASSEWGDGYKQLSQYVFANDYKYKKVIISGHYWQPYAYFLFYKKYDPDKFQKSGRKSQFDKYIFGGTSWDRGVELGDQNLELLSKGSKAMVSLSPSEYIIQKDNIKVLKNIYNHNGELVFIVGSLNDK